MEMENIGSQAQQSGEGLVRGVQHKVGDVIKHATFGYVSPLFYIYCAVEQSRAVFQRQQRDVPPWSARQGETESCCGLVALADRCDCGLGQHVWC